MPNSIQEQIVLKVAAQLQRIATANGDDNTIATVQRFNQSGVDLSVVPTILLKEGDVSVEKAESVYPSVQKRMELIAVAIARQDETPTSTDTRDGGAILNSLVADMERMLQRNRTWDGLAIETDAPSYLSVDMDAVEPHLAMGVRFEVVYRHLRNDPYTQV